MAGSARDGRAMDGSAMDGSARDGSAMEGSAIDGTLDSLADATRALTARERAPRARARADAEGGRRPRARGGRAVAAAGGVPPLTECVYSMLASTAVHLSRTRAPCNTRCIHVFD
jgi:hypothetical protein